DSNPPGRTCRRDVDTGRRTALPAGWRGKPDAVSSDTGPIRKGGLMFGFGFFSLALAIVAFVVARKALNQVAALSARLDAMGTTASAARPGPPPLTPLQELEQTLAASSPARQAATVADALAPAVAEETVAPTAATGGMATTPPTPQPRPGFEERIGTRWVVWVGGLTLAL